MLIFIPPIFPWYSELPDNSKYFVSTTGAASIGIALYFFKKKLDQIIKTLEHNLEQLTTIESKKLSDSRELSMTAELYEILLFLILPGLAVFGVISAQIKENSWWITGIFMGIILIWYILAQIQITKQYKIGEGKIVKTHVDTFFTYMVILGVFFTGLIFLFQK